MPFAPWEAGAAKKNGSSRCLRVGAGNYGMAPVDSLVALVVWGIGFRTNVRTNAGVKEALDRTVVGYNEDYANR